MKTLYLLRHAHAAPAPSPTMDDYERPLSEQGIEEARKVSAFLQEQNLIPDYILTSSALRTLETAKIVVGNQNINTLSQKKFYLCSAETLFNEIRTTEKYINSILVTGHNPGIAELASLLSQDLVKEHAGDFKTGTLIIFRVNTEAWHDVVARDFSLKCVFVP